ncbi:MAG: lysophospholipase L1-like esterase [Ilumatobacteraceae bacterium]|nr:lysophospholipase L1-like esterase [Ilumatobacteraceae bacterium]
MPSDIGGDGVHNWTSIIAGMLQDSGYNVELTVDATPGSGYVRTGASGTNFVDQIGRTVKPDTTLVVVFGSRYDDGIIPREQVGSTANTAIEKIRSISPSAAVLVIGPAWPDDTFPGYITGIEWNLKATAAADHATFLDPIADHWFFGQPTLIGSDGISPTDAGHAYMAERIEPAALAMLPARG